MGINKKSKIYRSQKKKVLMQPTVAMISLLAGVVVLFVIAVAVLKPSFWASLQNTEETNAQVAADTISVNASQKVADFTKLHRGVGMLTWEHQSPDNYPDKIPGLAESFKAAGVGLLRYAGGNYVHETFFDRRMLDFGYASDEFRAPDPARGISAGRYYDLRDSTGRLYRDNYSYGYSVNLLQSLHNLAVQSQADVMIQVNLRISDPGMWADLVRMAKERGWTSFRYYELSNENDCCEKTVTSTLFWQRARDYAKAMKAVDPTIQIIGPAPAVPSENWNGDVGLLPTISNYINPLFAVQRAGLSEAEVKSSIDAVTWHWYQQALGGADRLTWGQISKYSIGGYQKEGREFGEKFPRHLDQNALSGTFAGIKQGVTELNIESSHHYRPYSGSYLAALWFTDRMPALAASGVDFTTVYAGYGGDNAYAITYPTFGGGGGARVRPTYSAIALLANFFGDAIVATNYADKENLGVWAARRNADAAKLYVLVTNFQGVSRNLNISLQNFSANSGKSYTMRNTNPTVFEEDTCGAWQGGAGGETRRCIAEPVAGATQFVTSINNVVLRGAQYPTSLLTQQVAAIQGVPFSASGSNINYTFEPYTATVLELSSSATPPLPTTLPVPTQTTVQPTPMSTPVVTAAPVPTAAAVRRAYGGVPVVVPGKIESENYDEGGSNVGYFDKSAGNNGNVYRNDNVDLESNRVGGTSVGWVETGEWLSYTFRVAAGGMYTVGARVASANVDGRFDFTIDGSMGGSFNVANSGGWFNWYDVPGGAFNLSAGDHSIRLTAAAGNATAVANLDYIAVESVTGPPASTPTPTQNMSFDLNKDGTVNASDVIYMLTRWSL